MNGFLLDTNFVSELVKPRPEPKAVRWIDSVDEDLLFLSVLTLGEIRKGVAAMAAGARRLRLEAWLAKDIRMRFSGRVLAVDESIADRWGILAAASAARGRRLPTIDGLLAATALHHNLVFVTRNTADVENTGVVTLNPWTR